MYARSVLYCAITVWPFTLLSDSSFLWDFSASTIQPPYSYTQALHCIKKHPEDNVKHQDCSKYSAHFNRYVLQYNALLPFTLLFNTGGESTVIYCRKYTDWG